MSRPLHSPCGLCVSLQFWALSSQAMCLSSGLCALSPSSCPIFTHFYPHSFNEILSDPSALCAWGLQGDHCRRGECWEAGPRPTPGTLLPAFLVCTLTLTFLTHIISPDGSLLANYFWLVFTKPAHRPFGYLPPES